MTLGALENNPYRSPEVADAHPKNKRKTTFHFGLTTIILSIFAGVLLGAMTNAINGFIYPWHFAPLASPGDRNLWRVAVARGIEEGAVYGLLNGLAATLVIISMRISAAERPQPLTVVAMGAFFVLGAWLLGGVCALAVPLLGLKPTENFYYDVSSGFWTGDRRWVLWSIRAAVWGSPVCSLVAIAIALRQSSRKSSPNPLRDSSVPDS